ncbi:hypothetical protein CZ794_07070 [Psychrobacter sp. JB385]|nr:hypothetical protein CZ794_07070 [Psychrobacter sp. JB385]
MKKALLSKAVGNMKKDFIIFGNNDTTYKIKRELPDTGYWAEL